MIAAITATAHFFCLEVAGVKVAAHLRIGAVITAIAALTILHRRVNVLACSAAPAITLATEILGCKIVIVEKATVARTVLVPITVLAHLVLLSLVRIEAGQAGL